MSLMTDKFVMAFPRIFHSRHRFWWLSFSLLAISISVSGANQFYHLLAQSITGVPALSITPATHTLDVGLPWKFSGVGGVAPYSYSLIGANGSLDTSTGVYTSNTSGGYTVTVRVTDSASQTADATVTVPSAPVITCDGYSESLHGRIYDSGGAAGEYADDDYCYFDIWLGQAITGTIHFNSMDIEPVNDELYVYDWDWNETVFSGSTTPADIPFADGYFAIEFYANSSVVGQGYDITWSASWPSAPILMAEETAIHASESNFTEVSGGVGPYSYSIVSGGGSLSNVNGRYAEYNSPLTSTTAVIRVTDAINQTADVTITVFKNPLAVTNVNPNHGVGDVQIGLGGTGFMPGMTVTVGGTNCVITYLYETYIQCKFTASGSGYVDIVVTNHDGETVTVTNGFQVDAGSWTSMTPPSTAARSAFASVWTGDRWVIWGGYDPACSYAECVKNNGFVYNPATDSWSSMAASPLAGRVDPANVWTGHDVLITGGRQGGGNCFPDGAKYDPYSNTWTSIANNDWWCRQLFSQAWTGKELILYGGQWGGYFNSGVAYNLASNTWRAIPDNVPRWNHQAVWTGTKMFIFGGTSDNSATYPTTGLLYDPESNSWSNASATSLYGKGINSYDSSHIDRYMVWTGEKVFISGSVNMGAGPKMDAFYDPRTDTWTYPPEEMVATGSSSRTSMIWTGDQIIRVASSISGNTTDQALNPKTLKLQYLKGPTGNKQVRHLIWTGQEALTCFGFQLATVGQCFRLNLETLHNRLSLISANAWANVSNTGAPTSRVGATSLWTGQHLIVWGGVDGSTYLNTGYKYDPYADTWTAINTTGAPSGRTKHTAIWSGNRMIVWGGQTAAGTPTNTGAIYNPATDTWSAISTSGLVPSAREDHTVNWTGGKMLVWGGRNTGGVLGDGAIYNVASDTWSTMAATGTPPTSRARHQSLWTGSKMIIWGGDDGSTLVDSGSIYDLATDSWAALSTTSAPTGRADFSMILSQGKFVVWGGVDSAGTALNTGAIYDLTANTWTATNSTGAPSARSLASTVSTGRSMIVWGGLNGLAPLDDGFLFDTRSNSWSSMSSSGLSNRHGATAVWTGSVGDGRGKGTNDYRNNMSGDTSRLIIWGGFDGTSSKTDGKIYNLPVQ